MADHKELIDEVWEAAFKRKYLGIRRMKKILLIILGNADLKADEYISECCQYEYSLSKKNEWLKTDRLQLYKSCSGYFILTLYDEENEQIHHEKDMYITDLNLNIHWQTTDYSVSENYEKVYKELYMRKLRKYQERRDG